LEIVVDGIIYQLQAHGGISRIYSETLPRMCRIDETLKITLLMRGQSRQLLPQHPHIHILSAPQLERFLPPNPMSRFLKEAWLRLSIGRTGDKIWHSTYFTMPRIWRGMTVVTVADLASELFPDQFNAPGAEQFREQMRRCVLSADAVICISETTRNDVLNLSGAKPERILTVPLACGDIFKQLPPPINSMKLPVPEPFILYVGSRSHYKNFRLLIEAYSSWQHKHEVSLVAVGNEWSLDEMDTLIKLGITDRMHLLDKVDDETLCRLYNKAAAFVYPSRYEGFGIPLLEAMSCGCPVVASRIPSTVEVAGGCPIYFDPEQTEGLVTALDKALAEGRDSERTLAGLERAKGFSWQKTAEQTLEVYRSLSK
jgi:glycosyltransferase involved in cell wall biosynthesis